MWKVVLRAKAWTRQERWLTQQDGGEVTVPEEVPIPEMVWGDAFRLLLRVRSPWR